MPIKAKEMKKADAKSCRQCEHWDEIKQRVRVAESLEKAIKKIEQKFEETDFRPTMADYLRLVQMEQELEQGEQATREIKVTWVEPAMSDS